MKSIAVAVMLALSVVLDGCTSTTDADQLHAPVPGTTPVPSTTLVAERNPVPNTHIPVRRALPPEAERPGLAFRVLAHRPGDRSFRIAWVDSGRPECGAVSTIWAYETILQIVVTLHEPPTLTAARNTDCTAQGVVHIQRIRLTQPIADRTTSVFNGLPRAAAF